MSSRNGGLPVGRTAFLLVILLLVLVSTGLVILSPWALGALADNRLDWTRLSDIGQTYGAVSAIIAAVALLGVVASLIVQRRQDSATRMDVTRNHHVQLMRMAMEDPHYMECWGPYLTKNFVTERQYTYVNLIIAQWYSEYEIGEIPDGLLRASAASVFASEPGRTYWAASGSFWRDNYPGRRARRFHRVLDETYHEALKTPPAKPPVEPPAEPERAARTWPTLLAAAACGAAAVIGLRTLRRRRR